MIVHPDAAEETRNGILERIRGVIDKAQGTMGDVEEWGRRKFAYEIDHLNEGYYYVMGVQVEPPTMDELVRVLKITDEVIRVMRVRLEEKATATIEE